MLYTKTLTPSALAKGTQVDVRVEAIMVYQTLWSKMGLIDAGMNGSTFRFGISSLPQGHSVYSESDGADVASLSINKVEINKWPKYITRLPKHDLLKFGSELSAAVPQTIAAQPLMFGHDLEIEGLSQITANIIALKASNKLITIDKADLDDRAKLASNATKMRDALGELIEHLLTVSVPKLIAEGSKAEQLRVFLSPRAFRMVKKAYSGADTAYNVKYLENISDSEAMLVDTVQCWMSKKLGKKHVAGVVFNEAFDFTKFEAVAFVKSSINTVLLPMLAESGRIQHSVDYEYILAPQYGMKVNADLKMLQVAIINEAL